MDQSYIERNSREFARLRALVGRLDDDALASQVNGHWTVAGVLGHIAFWDARVLALADKMESGLPFTSDDEEPEDVDWINDSTRPLIHAIEPRVAAELALKIAAQTDDRVAALPPDRVYPNDEGSLINASRADHRAEHLDEIEAALRAGG